MPLGLSLRPLQTQSFRLGRVVSMLKMSSGEIDDAIAETARQNPMLILNRRPPGASSATDVLEMNAVEEPGSLFSHVLRDLSGLIAQGGLMEQLILALIDDLEPSGWLGRSTEEIAEALELSEELVDAALRVVQKRVEPAGLFARNLQDCLRLQLEDQDALDDSLTCLLDHLPKLETGGIAALVAATGLGEPQVQDGLATLRRLDPKPGSAFATDATLMRAPDVRLTASGDGWDIEFLSSLQADVRIARLPGGLQNAATRAALAEARALKQALDIRGSALDQVVRDVVKRQSEYFRVGPEALVPMTMSEIAHRTGFHLSTISRVLSGLLIEGPNGIVSARRLFTGSASAQAPQSKPMVQARIGALLAKEDPTRPLTDRRLTALLQSEGILVSRRVVSTYRQEIGFLAAPKRKLRA
ncbi:MAG: RNA polymerase subunit sigma-54 [Paracoccaceae bacterium]|nr:RNA polymerase subunit sigma-54 [Paracoccaceae bacterium]